MKQFHEQLKAQQEAAEEKYAVRDSERMRSECPFQPKLSKGTRRLIGASSGNDSPFLNRVVQQMKEQEQKEADRLGAARTLFSFRPEISKRSRSLAKGADSPKFEERMAKDIRRRQSAPTVVPPARHA